MAAIEMNGLQNNFQLKLFEAAERKQWNAISNLFEPETVTFADISKPNVNEFNKTILHYVCKEVDSTAALEAVQLIFTKIRSFQPEPSKEELENFINAEQDCKRTALQIAIERGHEGIIKILLAGNADTSIQVCKKLLVFNARYRKILLEKFDNGIYICKDEYDTENKDLWSVYFNFKAITGNTEDKLETQGLSTILSLSGVNRFEILMHALVQKFIDKKCDKYKWWIRFSMIYHITWYLMTAFFLNAIPIYNSNQSPCNSTDDELDLKSTNLTNINSTATEVSQQKSNSSSSIVTSSWFLCSFFTYFFITLIKEIVEFLLCPNWKFYVGQIENWGQIIVFIVAVFGAIVSRFEVTSCWAVVVVACVYSIGLVTSLLLVQGQFTKSQWFGVNSQLMMKSFKKLIPFLCTFLVLLVAFMVILHLTIPDELPKSWNLLIVKATKMFGILSGELNMSDVFTNDSIKDLSFVIKTSIVYILLILVVVVLFLNLWIANTVNDIEKLKAKATAAHYASRLEVINILEACLVRCSDFFGKRYSVLKVKGENIPAGISLSNDFTYGIKFNKIPSRTKKWIYENQSHFRLR